MKSKYNEFIAQVTALANDKYKMNSDEFLNELHVMIKIVNTCETKLLENSKPRNIRECLIQLVSAIEESRNLEYEDHELKARLLDLIRDELYGYLKVKEWCEKPSEMQIMQ